MTAERLGSWLSQPAPCFFYFDLTHLCTIPKAKALQQGSLCLDPRLCWDSLDRGCSLSWPGRCVWCARCHQVSLSSVLEVYVALRWWRFGSGRPPAPGCLVLWEGEPKWWNPRAPVRLLSSEKSLCCSCAKRLALGFWANSGLIVWEFFVLPKISKSQSAIKTN